MDDSFVIAAVKAFGLVGSVLFTAAGGLVVSAVLAVTWLDAVPPILTSIVAAGGAYLTYRQRRNEIKIEEVDHHSTGQDRLINQLQEQVDHDIREIRNLRYNFERMYRLVVRFHLGVAKLVAQLEAEGIEPEWTPPTDSEIDALIHHPGNVQRGEPHR